MASGATGEPELCQLANEEYVVGWICALTIERVAAQVFLDQKHAPPTYIAPNDNNAYTLGRVGEHNVVIAVLPGGQYGTASAAGVARDMLHSFQNVRIGLMVGIGGGAPSSKHDIRLGDVVVSESVHQYDFGKTIQGQPFQNTRVLAPPPTRLLTAINSLRADYMIDGHTIQEAIDARLTEKRKLRKAFSRPNANTDLLFRSDVVHPLNEASCSGCGRDTESIIKRPARDEDEDNPAIHHGVIASANQLMKDAVVRDQWAKDGNILCFETEAGGLMNHFPCLVIRGICDYSDTHKNKDWQGYAAMTAAAYAKDLLKMISPTIIQVEKKLSELLDNVLSSALDTKTAVQDLQISSRSEKILKWLSAPDPSTNFNESRKLHQPGTGQWLLDSSKYRSWKADSGSFLWLYGIPGCGKTILSSTIVMDLQNDPKISPNLLYFYFNFTDVEKRSTEKAVRSLIDQLYRKKREDAQEVVDSLYTIHENKTGGQPSHASLQQTLQTMIAKFRKLWIILDGLDECETRSQQYDGVMPWIQNLKASLPNVHILVTSRPEDDIESSIEEWAVAEQMISLQSCLVAEDISAYINVKVGQMGRWQTEPEIQKLAAEKLEERAQGMFRWVACQFDALEHCLSRQEVLRELETLPRTLDDTYTRMFDRIYPKYKQTAIRLLQLLTYSPRPVQVAEAVDAIAIEPARRPSFERRNRMPFPLEIVRYCPGFVSITNDGEGQVPELQLAHFSVQEYFRSDRLPPDLAPHFHETAAAEAIADSCLSYLLELDTSLPVLEVIAQYSFAEFSAQFWFRYVKVVELSEGRVLQTVKEYYASRNAFYLGNELHACDQDRLKHGPSRSTFRGRPNPLYCAAANGLLASAKLVLRSGANVNARCGGHGTALMVAMIKNHVAMVRLLLEHGAKMDPDCLAVAAGGGYEALVPLLLKYGAETDELSLLEAADGGYNEILRTLLHHGAELNSRCLELASSKGHAATVQLLIDQGAEADAVSLERASHEGHEAVVRLLLDHGVEADASSLRSASSSGHEAIVKLLLDHGAKAGARALQYASSGGHEAVVKLLLDHGAVADAVSLQRASHWAREAVVQLLLEHGADVNDVPPASESSDDGVPVEEVD